MRDGGYAVSVGMNNVTRKNSDPTNMNANANIQDLAISVSASGPGSENREINCSNLIKVTACSTGNQTSSAKSFISGAHDLAKSCRGGWFVKILKHNNCRPRELFKIFELPRKPSVHIPTSGGCSRPKCRGAGITNHRGKSWKTCLNSFIHIA